MAGALKCTVSTKVFGRSSLHCTRSFAHLTGESVRETERRLLILLATDLFAGADTEWKRFVANELMGKAAIDLKHH